MSWNNYSLLFLCFFAAGTATELILDLLQERYLRRRGNSVPSHLQGKVTSEAIARSIDYNLAKIRFRIPIQLFEAAVTWGLILFGFDLLDRSIGNILQNDVARGLAFFGALGFLVGLLNLPMELYSVFGIEARFGFNRQTIGSFFSDLFKNTLVATLFGGILLTAVLLLMDRLGELWWIPAFVVVVSIQLLILWIYPVLIMPLFNRFTPVDGALGDEIKRLASSAGFPVKGVVAMDGSRRSSHSNAFIIGLPGARRIVLYDTLIEKLSISELVAVLAHELGHFKLGHIRNRLIGMLIAVAAVFFLIGRFGSNPALQNGLGFSMSSYHGQLAACFLLAQSVGFPFGFLSRWFSRRDEYAADRFAVDTVGSGRDLKEALVSLTRQNLSSPGAHRLYRGYYNSHPALRERLAAIAAHDRARKAVDGESVRSAPGTPADGE